MAPVQSLLINSDATFILKGFYRGGQQWCPSLQIQKTAIEGKQQGKSLTAEQDTQE